MNRWRHRTSIKENKIIKTMTETKQNRKIKISDEKLLEYIKAGSSFEKTLYLDLGVKKIRLLCYSEEFIPHIKKQLTFVLREKVSEYDATIVLWKEDDVEHVHENGQLFGDNTNIKHIIITDTVATLMITNSETYFYGVRNLEPEEFVKEGHVFVKIFNKILKTSKTALVHGACTGLDNKGVLMCARGQKGKSTLSVLSMLEGFEYISDDYLTLESENNNLYAYPIYSIITLSPKMYNELYDKLEGVRFVSNSARKDKYVLNIANMHNRFRMKYPVKFCLALEFSKEETPSITECTVKEKGNAITQMIHSTVKQMQDLQEMQTIKKLLDMVSKFKFYKISLCSDIYKNVELLRTFIREYKDD